MKFSFIAAFALICLFSSIHTHDFLIKKNVAKNDKFMCVLNSMYNHHQENQHVLKGLFRHKSTQQNIQPAAAVASETKTANSTPISDKSSKPAASAPAAEKSPKPAASVPDAAAKPTVVIPLAPVAAAKPTIVIPLAPVAPAKPIIVAPIVPATPI
jgi:hypothetical protein